ncbi:MAG TPA: NAD-binding protein [Pirellulaceae bacterium]|nr:NAD-binding protein [Pirellulaceae bacterium]HMO93088.1 NAD-binding protein [Pirellulaceae bacterium]HMP69961.1 NAD-binding protein [Pirellulaceae bacterium]
MKSLFFVLDLVRNPMRRPHAVTLVKILVIFVLMVAAFTVLFKLIMDYEGQENSWLTAVYWVLVTMSTLGYGDVTFKSDLGRLFSLVVLLCGSTFMLALLPFMFIKFFYEPWAESQAAARAPKYVPTGTEGHVIITGLGIVERALVRLLKRARIPYVVLAGDLADALKLHDEGFQVMHGAIDDRETYQRARVDMASMVVAAHRDTTNTNIAFTVREISNTVFIAATASSPASVDILELAGCNQVLQLGDMLGKAIARRVLGRNPRSHVVGSFGDLLIAEAVADGTPLVGRYLKDIKLNEHSRVNVIGIWNRGTFSLAGPDTLIEGSSVLLLSGTRAVLDEYDALFCVYAREETSVVIVGGGRVGRATAEGLAEQGVDYRLVERNPQRIRDPERYVLGDAADLDVLEKAGIRTCSSVVVTTHDDDINVYLSIYCRKLRPDVQIIARANQDRNVSTLHRTGADFVLSYSATGSSSIYNLLHRGNLLLLAEGLEIIRIGVPDSLVGRSLAECRIRQTMGCNVVGIEVNGVCRVPDPHHPLPAEANLIIIGNKEGEERFMAQATAAKVAAR